MISPRNLSLAGATFLGGLLLALFGGNETRLHYQLEAQNQFEILSQRLSMEVEKRMAQPVYGLRALSGLCHANKSVDRLEFRSFVKYWNPKKGFHGVIGFGFIERVMRENIDSFLASERADYAPDFTIKTAGYLDDLYVINTSTHCSLISKPGATMWVVIIRDGPPLRELSAQVRLA